MVYSSRNTVHFVQTRASDKPGWIKAVEQLVVRQTSVLPIPFEKGLEELALEW